MKASVAAWRDGGEDRERVATSVSEPLPMVRRTAGRRTVLSDAAGDPLPPGGHVVEQGSPGGGGIGAGSLEHPHQLPGCVQDDAAGRDMHTLHSPQRPAFDAGRTEPGELLVRGRQGVADRRRPGQLRVEPVAGRDGRLRLLRRCGERRGRGRREDNGRGCSRHIALRRLRLDRLLPCGRPGGLHAPGDSGRNALPRPSSGREESGEKTSPPQARTACRRSAGRYGFSCVSAPGKGPGA